MTHKAQPNYRQRRKRASVKQADLAADLGVDQASISRFENYGVPLPKGLTEADYEAALDRLASTGASK